MRENFNMINITDYELLDIDNIEIITNPTTMYDIKIEDDKTFFISKNEKDNILVHNCDGSHIAGLILNLFENYWPELLEADFLYQFVTPILKV